MLSHTVNVARGPGRLLPVSGIHQLRSQTQFFERLVADHHDDGGGRGWDDARWQSFGQSPTALLFDQLPERLDDWSPPFDLNKTRVGLIFGTTDQHLSLS